MKRPSTVATGESVGLNLEAVEGSSGHKEEALWLGYRIAVGLFVVQSLAGLFQRGPLAPWVCAG